MSGVMEEAMWAWERGLASVPDRRVCSSHIDDYAIRLFIKRKGSRGRCDYCGNYRIVLELADLMEFLTDALTHFYTDPANFMTYISAEGGYIGDYDGPWEMLDSLGLEVEHQALYEDIFNSLDHSSAWASEGRSASDFKYEGWLHFKHLVKHQSRYLFSNQETFRIGTFHVTAEQYLKELASDIRTRRMVTTIKAGTPIYRCRQHMHTNDVTKAAHICAPMTEYAVFSNRMSAAGVSMFYGAFDVNTAKMETLNRDDTTRPYCTIAEFSSDEDLVLIDLSKIPYVSPFDQEHWDLYDKVEFLSKFLNDFASPIAHDGREHIEYVPTQIITEYLRYKFHRKDKRPIDGIIYPSSKSCRQNACVLFMDHYECLEKLNLRSSLITKRIKMR